MKIKTIINLASKNILTPLLLGGLMTFISGCNNAANPNPSTDKNSNKTLPTQHQAPCVK